MMLALCEAWKRRQIVGFRVTQVYLVVAFGRQPSRMALARTRAACNRSEFNGVDSEKIDGRARLLARRLCTKCSRSRARSLRPLRAPASMAARTEHWPGLASSAMRTDPTPLQSTPLHSIPVQSTRLDSTPIHSTPSDSTLLERSPVGRPGQPVGSRGRSGWPSS